MLNIIQKTIQAFKSLFNSVPEMEDIKIPSTEDQLPNYCSVIVRLVIMTLQNYEKCLQDLENTLRKHIKNEIQLKIYYEHLESVISELKIEKNNKIVALEQMKTEIQTLKEREKYYLTITNQYTRPHEDSLTKLDSKMDTISRIKNRLFFNNTGEFYGHNFIEKNSKQNEGENLNQKRQSLQNTIQKLYEVPHEKKDSLSHGKKKRVSSKHHPFKKKLTQKQKEVKKNTSSRSSLKSNKYSDSSLKAGITHIDSWSKKKSLNTKRNSNPTFGPPSRKNSISH